MQEVRLELATYNALQDNIRTKSDLIDTLYSELAKVKKNHKDEIEKMANEGKVRYISINRHQLSPSLFYDEKVYKGFDDVKAEVEEHFKQGLFDEELEKYMKEKLDNIIKQSSERKQVIDNLRAEIMQLKGRNLWQRIWNK